MKIDQVFLNIMYSIVAVLRPEAKFWSVWGPTSTDTSRKYSLQAPSGQNKKNTKIKPNPNQNP